MRKFIAGLTLIAALTTLVVVCRPDGRKAARPGLAPGITDPTDRSEDDRRRLAVIVDEQRRLIAEAADLDGAELTRVLSAGGLDVALAIDLPGLDRETAEAIVQQAHIVCPYSHATRGSLDVRLTVR